MKERSLFARAGVAWALLVLVLYLAWVILPKLRGTL